MYNYDSWRSIHVRPPGVHDASRFNLDQSVIKFQIFMKILHCPSQGWVMQMECTCVQNFAFHENVIFPHNLAFPMQMMYFRHFSSYRRPYHADQNAQFIFGIWDLPIWVHMRVPEIPEKCAGNAWDLNFVQTCPREFGISKTKIAKMFPMSQQVNAKFTCVLMNPFRQYFLSQTVGGLMVIGKRVFPAPLYFLFQIP